MSPGSPSWKRVSLRAKLRRLDAWNAARRTAAARYEELLAGLDGVRLPARRPGNDDVWHLYTIRVAERDRVAAELKAAGIGVGIHYPTPVHLTAAYAGSGHARGQHAVAERAAGEILSLPMFPHLTEEHLQAVAAALSRATLRQGRAA